MEEMKTVLEELRKISEKMDSIEAETSKKMDSLSEQMDSLNRRMDSLESNMKDMQVELVESILACMEITKDECKKISEKLDNQIKDIEIVLNQNCKDITYLRAIK